MFTYRMFDLLVFITIVNEDAVWPPVSSAVEKLSIE